MVCLTLYACPDASLLPPLLFQGLHHRRHCPILDEGNLCHRLLTLQRGEDTQRAEPRVRCERRIDRRAQRLRGLEYHRTLDGGGSQILAARNRLHFGDLPCREGYDDLR